jgi:acetyl-CoA acetyltransferase family protein
MTAKNDVLILEGARTPMAEYNGSFAEVSAIELGAHAAREALSRSGVDPARVGHVIFGNALQTSGDAIYGARHVGLKAGVPKEVPAVTVNRLCGSGFESIVQGAHRILLGETDVVLAGGMENMSQAPHVIRGARKGLRLGQGQLEDSLMVALLDSYCGLYMAQTSDRVASKYGITRAEQDDYALCSQQRAAQAWQAGRLSEEVVGVDVKAGRKTLRVEKDDHLRPDSTLEGLAALPPSFGKDGSVTAGNASGIVDGAAAVVVASASAAGNKKPLGRLVSWAVVGGSRN